MRGDHEIATGKREAAFDRMMAWIEQGNAQQAVTNNPTGSSDTARAKERRQDTALENTIRKRQNALDRAIRDGDLTHQRLLEEDIKRLEGKDNLIDQLRADAQRFRQLENQIATDAAELSAQDWADHSRLQARIDASIRELGLESVADLPR